MWVILLWFRLRKIVFCSFKNFDWDKFLEDFSVVFFYIMDIFDDLDDMLYVFELFYNNIFDEYLLFKYVYVCGY